MQVKTASKTYEGHMTKDEREASWSIGATSKRDAYLQMKLDYPDWQIVVTGYYNDKIRKAVSV